MKLSTKNVILFVVSGIHAFILGLMVSTQAWTPALLWIIAGAITLVAYGQKEEDNETDDKSWEDDHRVC